MTISSGPHAVADRRTAAPTEPTVDTDEHPELHLLLRRAALLHLDGDLAGAEARYRCVLDADPTNAPALNNLGLLLSQRGDPVAALAIFDRLGPADTLSAVALVNVANARLALGDAHEAIALLERAVLTDPESSAWGALGQARLVAGDIRGAESALRASLEHHPARADVLRSFGACLAERGALDDAASAFRGAIELDESDASSWRQLAVVLLAKRDLGSAVRAARRAVELEPDSVPTRRELAVALTAIGEAVEAAEQLDRALEVTTDADLLVDRAVLHLAAGELDLAAPRLEEAARDDRTGRARLHLAYCQLAMDRPDEARANLVAASALAEPFASQATDALSRIGHGTDLSDHLAPSMDEPARPTP